MMCVMIVYTYMYMCAWTHMSMCTRACTYTMHVYMDLCASTPCVLLCIHHGCICSVCMYPFPTILLHLTACLCSNVTSTSPFPIVFKMDYPAPVPRLFERELKVYSCPSMLAIHATCVSQLNFPLISGVKFFVGPYSFFFFNLHCLHFIFMSVFILASAALLDYRWLGLQET